LAMAVPFKVSKLSLATGDAITQIFILTVQHINKSFFNFLGGALCFFYEIQLVAPILSAQSKKS
jgi:hypothetical protein